MWRRRSRLPRARRRRIVTGPCHGDAFGRYAIIGSDELCRCRTRHHHFAHRSKGSPFTAMQGIGAFGRQPPFQRERMMHQPEQRMPARKLPLRRPAGRPMPGRRSRSAGRPAPADRSDRAAERVASSGARKSVADIETLDVPSQLPEFGHDPPVVSVAAGRRIEAARHREHDALHHKGASYCARATCDSDSVMRSALSSRPGRPSSPARAGFARPSKMYLDRNSVVVFLPLNSGTSSRL